MFRSLDEVARIIRNKMRLSDAAAVGLWALTREKDLHPSMDNSEHI
jgi:hypothetical protein